MDVLSCKTVGHSTLETESFIALIKAHSINCVIDVRSVPWSAHVPRFNRDVLQHALENTDIIYLFMGDCLGARYDDPGLLFPDGRVDFSKVSGLDTFLHGIGRVVEGMEKGYRIALMCAEKDPFECHRFVLVSRELAERNIRVEHIISETVLIDQAELEARLLEKYFKKRSQLSLFAPNKSERELLAEAYALRNRDIAYAAPTRQEDSQ